jgi:hypothetical protein
VGSPQKIRSVKFAGVALGGPCRRVRLEAQEGSAEIRRREGMR